MDDNILESVQFRKAFGEFIKAERKRQNLFQRDICFELGITQAYYSNIENGKREIRIVLAKKICDILSVGFDDFMRQYQEKAKQALNENKRQKQNVTDESDDDAAPTEKSFIKVSDLLKGLEVEKKERKSCSIYLTAETNAKLERLAKQYGCGKGKIVESLLKNIP